MNHVEDAEAIILCGEEDYIWMSEKAEERLSWILTGIIVLAITPVLALAFLI